MTTEYKLFIDGQWVAAGAPIEIKNKYNGETIAVLATARREDVDAAISAAERAEPVTRFAEGRHLSLGTPQASRYDLRGRIRS